MVKIFFISLLLFSQQFVLANPILPKEKLHLTVAHYENAREVFKKGMEMVPAEPIEPVFNGEKTNFKIGDDIKLGFLPSYVLESNRLYKDFIKAKIEALIFEGKILVGLKIQRHPHENRFGIETPPKETVWLKDIDPKEVTIVKRAEELMAEVKIELSEIVEPETTFPITFPWGRNGQIDMSVPLAVGDEVVFDYKEGKRTILISYYPAGHGRKIEAIVKDNLGNPVGLKFKYDHQHDNIYPIDKNRIDADNMMTIYFSEILRKGSRLETSSPKYIWFRFPKSRVRIAESMLAITWLPSIASDKPELSDSGNFTLRISNGPAIFETGEKSLECPIGVKDELLLSMKNPGSVLGFYYERYIVQEVLFNDTGESVGVRVERLGSGDPTTVIHWNDFNRDDSYIETTPWAKESANKIPAAFDKRKPYKPYTQLGHREDNDPGRVINFFKNLFSQVRENQKKINELHDLDSDNNLDKIDDQIQLFEEIKAAMENTETEETIAQSLPIFNDVQPWVQAPMEYESWLTKYSLENDLENKQRWARWVFRIELGASKEVIEEKYRELSQAFPVAKSKCSGFLEKAENRRVGQILTQAFKILE